MRNDMKKLISKKGVLFVSLLALTLAFTGCGQKDSESDSKLTGEIRIDGSSTVFPITEAIVEEFNMVEPNVKIPVGVSGTGGGFKKFIAKETDISNASRPIKDEEAESAKNAGVEYTEFKIAYDGLSVLVNPENTWVDYLTVEELATIWMPDSKVKTWKDIRAEWPEEEIKFYAPGTDSGTFDYFTEEINGESGAIRSDFTGSEDDNVLVQGIAGDKNALGFFGFAYYEENQDKLKVVPIDNGNGAITPTFDTIKSGEYATLSRPIFIYVNNESLKREEVKGFVKFYLENAADIVPEVGYVSLPEEEYETELELLR